MTVMPLDLIQAVLRLAPDGRAEAVREAAGLTDDAAGEVGRALRWALGSDEEADRPPSAEALNEGGGGGFGRITGIVAKMFEGYKGKDQRDEDAEGVLAKWTRWAVWIAAGRARQVGGDLEELTPVPEVLDYPNAVHEAEEGWELHVEEKESTWGGNYLRRRLQFDDAISNNRDRLSLPLLPASSLSQRRGRPDSGEMHSAPMTQWEAGHWPANPDGFYCTGATMVLARLDDKSSVDAPNHAYLHPLFEPTRPWSGAACLLAMLGLVSKDADVNGLAMDAVIEAVGDGRADGGRLGGALAGLADPRVLKLNRLAASLGEVSRVSPLHALAAAEMLQAVMAAYEELPRDAHHGLQLLRELMIDLGLGPGERLRAKLAGVTGGGKAAKLAREIAAMEPTGGAAVGVVRAAAMQRVRADVERGERWGA